MKKYLILSFSVISILVNSQIITNDTKVNEESKREIKKEKPKSGVDIFFGITPSYTFRTLEVNDGLFAKPLGIREEEKGEWTTGFNIGVRTKLSEFLKLEMGAGYYSDRESFDFAATDSVFNYVNTYRSIAFPIKLAYSYGNQISFYGSIGLAPKAFVNMKREVTTLDINRKEKTETTKERNKFNMFLIDATATIGTQIKLSPHYGIFAMAEYRQQINSNYTNQSPYVRRPYALGFNLGVEIYL